MSAAPTATLDDDLLDETFAALASATRRAMLARLAEGEMNVTELSAPFDLSGPAITKHLKVLERAGLIVRSRRAQYRPCTLEPAPLRAVASWTEQYRPVWEARFDRLEEQLTRMDRGGDHDG
jgi:DNA-binding transcriptional ArsR family regulator